VSDREQFPNLSQVYGGGVPIALTGDIPHAEWPEDMPIRDIIQVLHDLIVYMRTSSRIGAGRMEQSSEGHDTHR
jgi:hypothetical protein